jgi:hypothetical protein
MSNLRNDRMDDTLSELRDLLLIATIITMDGNEIAEGVVKLGKPPSYGSFKPRRDCDPLSFTTAKSLVVKIEAMEIETVNWSICDRSAEGCPMGLHFHFLSPN